MSPPAGWLVAAASRTEPASRRLGQALLGQFVDGGHDVTSVVGGVATQREKVLFKLLERPRRFERGDSAVGASYVRPWLRGPIQPP